MNFVFKFDQINQIIFCLFNRFYKVDYVQFFFIFALIIKLIYSPEIVHNTKSIANNFIFHKYLNYFHD